MIALQILLLFLYYYICVGIAIYGFGVIKRWEIVGSWNFNIDRKYIAEMWRYPYWLLFWLELVFRLFKR